MNFAMILNQKMLTSLAVASCLVASTLAMFETNGGTIAPNSSGVMDFHRCKSGAVAPKGVADVASLQVVNSRLPEIRQIDLPESLSWHYPIAAASGSVLGRDDNSFEAPKEPTEAIENPASVPPIANAKAVCLQVWPKSISLSHANDRQKIVVQLVYSNGVTVDVTDRAKAIAAKPIVKLVDGYWVPIADGKTQLKVRVAKHQQSIPVKVVGAKKTRPISFTNDVMPVFSKSGCNAGSCHGASRGKDGFRLSLFGFDPQGDYHRLTRELPGRRIDLALPDDCLLITKATGAVPHSGGQLFDKNSESCQTLLQWLNSGATFDKSSPPKVTSIELFPESVLLSGEAAKQQLTVLAHYEDGSDRDVTSLAYFSTNQDNVLSVDQSGEIEAGSRGEAFVMCRFDTHTVGRSFIVLPAKDDFKWQPVDPANYIDVAIHDKLKALRIQPSERCTDAEFLRRCYLDICGLLPTPKQLEQFVSNPSPDKRSRCVDRLLEREEFGEMWVMKWSELLQVRSSNDVSYKATLAYYEWLRNQFAADVPIDQWVRELLTAQGGTMSVPRPITTTQNPTLENSPRTLHRFSWGCGFNVPNAITIHLIDGRWTTTTASQLSSPRLVASGAPILESKLFPIGPLAKLNTQLLSRM